jgi:hypothetical protein
VLYERGLSLSKSLPHTKASVTFLSIRVRETGCAVIGQGINGRSSACDRGMKGASLIGQSNFLPLH